MAQRISRFSVGQSSKFLGVMYALLGLLFAPFFILADMFGPEGQGGVGTIFAIAFPLIYGVLGYVFSAIGFLLYNLIAGWVGGIEVELEQS